MKKLIHTEILIHALSLLACIILASQTITAEASTLPEQFSDLPSYSVSLPKGTKSHTTYNMLRDHEGMMWISSANGIERYDGLSFKNYSLSHTQLRLIRDGFQETLYMDPDGKIYCFNERSLVFRYNQETDVFDLIVSLKVQQNLHSVKAMAAEGDLLHLGTSSGIRIFDTALDSVVDVINAEEDIHRMTPYTNGNYVYGTNKIIGIYYPHERKARTLCNINHDVYALYYDEKRDLIWAGTNGEGLFVIDASQPDRVMQLKGVENSIITTLAPFGDNYILIGTDGDGLKICRTPESSDDFDIHRQIYLFADDSPTAPYQLPISVIKGIWTDNEHIWLSMDMGGLALMRSGGDLIRLVNPYARNVSDNSVFGADFGDDGLLWVAFNNSIGSFDPKTGKAQNIYMNHESRFLTVKRISDGTVWAGGYNTGIYHFDPITGQREHIPSIADQPVLDCIWSVKEDMHKDLWIGGLNFPLTRLHFTEERKNGKLQRKYERTFYPVSQVTDMIEINADTMVVTTFDGFWVVNRTTGQAEVKMHDESVWSYTNSIGAVAVRDGHELWLATTGAGLVCYDLHTDKIESYHLDHGLPSVELRGIEMLNDTLVCASTENNGIFVFDAKNRRYVTALSQNEFTGINQFIRTASAASGNGKVLFGTDQGAIIFDMDNFSTGTRPYEILVDGEHVYHDSIIHLPASDQNIKIAFTTTDVYDQSMYRFEYRIRGLVDEWQKVDDSRRLRYMAVPAGTYTLEIRAFDASNRYREKEVKVVVDSEIYFRWYFILLYIIVVLALCFFAAIWAVNYIMRRNDTLPGEKPSRLSLSYVFSIRQAKLNYHLMVRQSETDALTGLRNRFSGQSHICNFLTRHNPGVLLIMDCDKFKHVNDTFGHMTGDELLKQIAHAMRHTFPNDITVRLGGDEFAIFLKGQLTPEQVKAQAERFFTAIRNIHLSGAPSYVPSISIGAAFTSNDERNTFESLYSHADKKLYESKEITGCSIVM